MTADYSNVRVDAKSSMGPWTPRIGSTATRLRNMWRRTFRLGVWLLLGLPVTVVAIWRAIQLNSGGAVVALAVLCSVSLSAAVIGLSLLPVSAIRRSQATDAATAYLRHEFADVVPSEVRLWLRSPLTFDAGVAELAHHGQAVGSLSRSNPRWNRDPHRFSFQSRARIPSGSVLVVGRT